MRSTPTTLGAAATALTTTGQLTFGPATVTNLRRLASTKLGEPDIDNLACGDDDAAFEHYEFARDNEVVEMAKRLVAKLYPSAEGLRFSFEDDEVGSYLTVAFTHLVLELA